MSTIQPLRPYTQFVDDKGVLTKDGYDFLFNLYNRLNGGGSGVDADTLELKTWESPGTIGSTAPSTARFTTVSASSQITSTVATGIAPFVVASTTNIPNLNASSLSGATFASPGVIGGTTPAAGTFTTLNATSDTNIVGLTATGTVTLSPANLNVIISPSGTGTITINPATAGTINNTSIGATTQSTGKFTTVTATGAFGCNTKTAQTAYASGGAVATTSSINIAPAGYGYTTAAQADAIVTLLNSIRAALVANGIMS